MAGVQSGRRGSRGKKRRKGKPSKLNLCHATLTSEVEAPLEALLQTLGALIQQAKVTSYEAPPELALIPPLPAYQATARFVSDNCTRLSVLFSSPPPPTPGDCAAIASKLEQTASHLLATYLRISPIYGVALHREVETSVLSILRGVESLVTTIITTGSSTVQRGLRDTGTVWEYCDKAAKLSKDNKMAAVKELLSQLHLIRDGCREVEEVAAVRGRGVGWGGGGGGGGDVDEISEGVESVQLGGEGGCDGPREWNKREEPLAEPCVNLVKLCSDVTSELCRVVVTSGGCSVEDCQARELDETLAAVLELSPLVDELVGELPAPLLWPDCREAGERLAVAITHLLHIVSPFHFSQCAGDKWSSLLQSYSTSVTALTQQIVTTADPPS